MGISALGAGSLISAGTGLAGLFGAGPTANNAPPQFQLPNEGSAASGALGGIGNLGSYNLYQPNLGQVSGISQGLVNNPYAGGYQSGSNTAGQLGQSAGLGAFGAGNQLYGTGTQILGTAFDPQQALYNRTLAQVTNQQNVQNANAGVGSSPYGAGLTDQSISNFNIDWQAQQLQNQIAGLGAAGGAFNTAAGLQSGGANTYAQGAALPYSTFGTIGNNQIGALGTAGQFGAAGAGQAQTPIQDYLAYLGQGAQQQGVNNQTAQLGFGENAYNTSQLGYGLGGLGSGLSSYNPFSSNYGSAQLAANPIYTTGANYGVTGPYAQYPEV